MLKPRCPSSRNLLVALLLAAMQTGVAAQIQAAPALGAWPTTPDSGIRVASQAGVAPFLASQWSPSAIPDGAGGAFVTFTQGPTYDQDVGGSEDHIIAQRIGSDGALRWGMNGVVVCPAHSIQWVPMLIDDGDGGAIFAWQDQRYPSFDPHYVSRYVWLQKIDSTGAKQWTSDGVSAGSPLGYGGWSADGFWGPLGYENQLALTSDSQGGAVVVWQAQSYLYAQRISADGNRVWGDNGLTLAFTVHYCVSALADGKGGAFIAYGDSMLILGHLDSTGRQIGVQDTLGHQAGVSLVRLVPDASGGAIATWLDSQNDDNLGSVRAQRVTADGKVLWRPGGVVISGLRDKCTALAARGDGAGGVIGVWVNMTGAGGWLYAQHVNSSGQTTWLRDGVALSNSPTTGWTRIDLCARQGAVVVWTDEEYDATSSVWKRSVRGQHVDDDGWTRWGAEGVPVLDQSDYFPPAVVPSVEGSCIVLESSRGEVGAHSMFAQRLRADGTLGPIAGSSAGEPSLAMAVPNPLRGGTLLRYSLAQSSRVDLSIFDLAGRLVRTLASGDQGAGDHTRHWEARDGSGRGVLPGVYFARLAIGSRVSIVKLVVVR